MKTKPRKNIPKPVIHPLQICEAIPITDPAEIEALERRIRAVEKKMVDGFYDGSKKIPRKRK